MAGAFAAATAIFIALKSALTTPGRSTFLMLSFCGSVMVDRRQRRKKANRHGLTLEA
jgi:hypothetical protein